MKLTWLTAAFLLLLPHTVDAQTDPRPQVANRPMNVATFDEAVTAQQIEQLAQAYRISIYNVFRADRAQYNQHRVVLQETFAAWRAAGSRADQREELAAWLKAATRAVQSAPRSPLPARPAFDVKIAKKPEAKVDIAVSPKPATAQPHTTLKPTIAKVDEPKTAAPAAATVKQPSKKQPSKVAPAIKPPVQKPAVQKPAAAKPEQTAKPSLPAVKRPAEKPASQPKTTAPEKTLPPSKPTVKLPKVEEIAPALPLAASAKQPRQIAPAIEPPTQKPAAQPSISIPTLPTPSVVTPPIQAGPIHAGPEQPSRQPRPSATQFGAAKKPAPTRRQTTQIPMLPTLDDSSITQAPPAPSQAKQPTRIAPRVSPLQRSAQPRSSVPRSNSLAERTKRTTPSGTLADRRSWRSPRRAADTRTKPPKTGTGLGNKSPVRSPSLPTLPGLSAKDLAGIDKSDKSPLALPKNPVDKAPDGEVNLIELAARIAGTNMALRGVESQLSKSREWDSTQLTSMVTALKQLSGRRHDLALFRNLLPEKDRRLVGKLESPRAAISQCGTRLSETRDRVKSSSYRDRPKERKEELKKLDELSRELAKLVTGS